MVFGRKDFMKKNEYKIETVEFYYNGASDRFDAFLNSVIRDYISADKTEPDPDCEIIDKSS